MFTILTIIIASFNILFTSSIVYRLIRYGKLQKYCSKNRSRRISILHAVNTYIHILGETIVILLMVGRTLHADLHLIPRTESAPTWHCRLLNYLISTFAAGIYGSCFLQALFRFWRIMQPQQRLYRTFTFHLRLVAVHELCVVLVAIPVWFRAIYLPSENYCLNRFTDTWTSVYISITSVGAPILGIIVVYLKIVLYMKRKWRSRKRWRRMERDRLMIKRMLLLVIVLSSTSGAAVLLWLLMFIQQRMHPLSYRLLCLIIAFGMLISSVTLLVASPQLRRAMQPRSSYQQRQQRDTLDKSDSVMTQTNTDEVTLTDASHTC